MLLASFLKREDRAVEYDVRGGCGGGGGNEGDGLVPRDGALNPVVSAR